MKVKDKYGTIAYLIATKRPDNDIPHLWKGNIYYDEEEAIMEAEKWSKEYGCAYCVWEINIKFKALNAVVNSD